MNSVLRIALWGLAALFALVSLLIPASASQVRKNKMLLADMRDVVAAINEFKRRSGHLPQNEELSRIEDTVPRRYSLKYGFRFGAPPADADRNDPSEIPDGGWMIWYWRGEWAEYYTSWDDKYSLEGQTSLRTFCGALIYAPLAAVGFIGLSFLPIVRKKSLNQPSTGQRP